MIVAGLAALSSRKDFLPRVLGSLLPQVDLVHVMLNGAWEYRDWGDIDEIFDSKVEFDHDPTNRLGDAAKFKWIFDNPGREAFFLSCDDDLAYPPTYARDMAMHHGRFAGAHVITLHGSVILRFPLKSYYEDRHGIACLRPWKTYTAVHLPGSGVASFYTSALPLCEADFPKPNMADIWLGLAARRHGVPVLVAPHDGEGEYLVYDRSLPLEDTIWGRYRFDDATQTAVLNAHAQLFKTRA